MLGFFIASFVYNSQQKDMIKFQEWILLDIYLLTLSAPTSQNDQTHSNNSSLCLRVFDHFVGLAFKGLRSRLIFKIYMINIVNV